VAYLMDPDFETQGSNNIRPKRRPKDWLLDRYTMLCYQYRVKYYLTHSERLASQGLESLELRRLLQDLL